ncbi:hypothetical protein PENDEC_c002G06467 [Penicillium decumbens]|uniref:Isochorismatase-like domain-containing protein n=1 Tax=Penicillium decumbens TaxID=69771 RepID=A0A1V6PKV8_PENDC|nr:hypothetical protein PENDEC_c002G06467 [Penicillium decumbens]
MGTTTLLILDIENGVLDMFPDPTHKAIYLQRLEKTISEARKNNIKIIHVITAFRRGYPEKHANSGSSLASIAAAGKFIEGSSDVSIHPAAKPTPEEVVITKRRVSAFMGTELEMILRCYDTNNLVIAGVATSGAVLSTIRHAQDLDFQITVLHDLCMDRDEEVHRVLIEKVFGKKCVVVTGEEWVDGLNASSVRARRYRPLR